MAKFEVTGKITHYPSRDGVSFDFQKLDKKDTEKMIEFSYPLLFEIWKSFKNNKIKISITKIE